MRTRYFGRVAVHFERAHQNKECASKQCTKNNAQRAHTHTYIHEDKSKVGSCVPQLMGSNQHQRHGSGMASKSMSSLRAPRLKPQQRRLGALLNAPLVLTMRCVKLMQSTTSETIVCQAERTDRSSFVYRFVTITSWISSGRNMPGVRDDQRGYPHRSMLLSLL